MARRPDHTSPAQFRRSSKVTFRGRSVCAALSGTAPRSSSQPRPLKTVRSLRLFARLQGQAYLKVQMLGLCHPEARYLGPHSPLWPRTSPTPLHGRSSGAYESTSHPSGAPTTRRRVPWRSPVIKGPKGGPRPSIPVAPSAKAAEGKVRPVAQAAPRAALRPHPNSWAEPCSSRGSGATWPRPKPRSQNTWGEPCDVGKSSRLPPSWLQDTFSGRGGGAQAETF
ncbi:hypothetical protein NDU88_001199 [Pleurodeles waltl]|uniref:Uncharacterized protein n=1 Tax=Pleurodeles waltl TaxID=8319 RepID=A0AAV7SYX3_PLEWA|nr:hypothetical protein NDU88_001199 [Pleurodeles waltl]